MVSIGAAPTPTTGPGTPIAVIGMGCRLPGGIESPEQLWQALLRGDDLITEVPRDRWDLDDYYDPEPGVPGRTSSKWGAFIDDLAGFDAQFFGINEREAAALDPQHRLLLETSWEAIEHAGLTGDAVQESRTGVFLGLTHVDYQLVNVDSEAMEGPYGYEGNTFALASGRIAHALGLHGPALTVDTACSSGLMAIHLACRSLIEGESEMALAGGAYVVLEPKKFVAGSAQNHLSPTGRCRGFDVAADGYVCGEAAASVLLKRLPDALRDGDRVLAVIRGSAANQDGHTVNISTPSATAQTAVYQAALAASGVDPRTVGMIEAHGPGTPVGDPIEYASLSAVYGEETRCALGSLKSNLGHAQSASGVLGLMKAVLALQHGQVPRHLHFTRMPDEMARIKTNLFIPTETTPWPTQGHPRRAAVSSYGVSGTNVHAIVEEAGEQAGEPAPSAAGAGPGAGLLFPLSSTSAPELRRSAARLADWVERRDDVELADLGYTLARRRAHRPIRTAVLAGDRPGLVAALRDVADSDTPFQPAVGRGDRGPVWVFSGQGSQWAQMGAALLAAEPVFAATIAELEPLIAAESGFSVTAAMTAPEVVTGIDRVQPTVFAMQIAMAATMTAHGVRPGAVIGHSMGETAAAVVAGALSLQDGVRVICRRSKLMATIAGSGAMGTVELPAKQVLSELTMRDIKDVVVAVVASPQSTVIGGATETVESLIAAWEESEVMARRVAVDVASHSPQVDPILTELADVLADITPLTPTIPYYSATGFDPREEPVCNAGYWVNNLRRTVRFAAAVRAAMEDGYRVFAELAPHPLLTRAVEQTADSLDVPLATLAAMRREQALPDGLRGFMADLHSAGAAVDFTVPYPGGQLVDAPLPTWTHEPLWLSRDGRDSAAHGGHTVTVHPLLGPHVRLAEEPERHVWQGEVGTVAAPWLADHRVREVAVLPGAAYCEMALAAAHAVFGAGAQISDLRFERALLLDEHTGVAASAAVVSPGVAEFVVQSAPESGTESVAGSAAEAEPQAAAVLHAGADEQPPAYDIAALLAQHPDAADGAGVRALLDERGVQYGPAFAGLLSVHTGAGDSVLAEVALPVGIRAQQGAYGVHPALLDACFQSVAAAPPLQAAGGALVLPLGARRLRSHGPARNAHYCYTRITDIGPGGVEADLDVLDQDGTVLLSVQGLLCGTGESEEAQRSRLLAERLLTIEWQQQPAPEAGHDTPGNWVLISMPGDTAAGALTTALTTALNDAGAQCSTFNWHSAEDAGQLGEVLRSNPATGVVVLCGPPADADAPQLGRRYVGDLVRITRELTQIQSRTPQLFVVTRGAQTVLAGESPNLEQGGLRGLARVVGAEHPQLRITEIDVDDDTGAELLARQLLSGSGEDEIAWRDGVSYTARLRSAPLHPEERRTVSADGSRDGMRLQIRNPGDLQTLEFVANPRVSPGPGQIEVAVAVSSLNFADVLVAMGLFPAIEGRLPELGLDFAGVVTAVGPGVVDHKVGDRVGGFSANGCWSTFVTCDARLAVTLPPELTEHQAVALASTTATAWYGLHDQAGICAGDRVLIHSGTGGVGQAAIAIARAAGAEIYATAGSDERRQLLRDMGITHVYDSRSAEFADQIRRDTDGYGVDIVLNSLTGAAQRAGFELLAVGGRFVEIGKRDVYGNTRLGLFPFRRNLTFYYLDLALMSVTHPQRVGELLRTVYQRAAAGELPPATHTDYPIAEAATAIRIMSAAGHTGKLLLEVSAGSAGTRSVVVPPEEVPVFRPDGAYLITGGLGGLGLFFAEKLAAAGCGRIVLTSRSQPGPAALETIERIRALGGDVAVHCGDIADPATARDAVAAATATGLPLRGVLHGAAVVDDATLANITDDLIERDWAPKVLGAWNLHNALADVEAAQPLDWFCSFSSAAALVGSPGQGAYAAANSWLDAFTRWRRAQGLAAVSIGWGPWAQIGRATDFAASVGAAIAPEEGAYAFETLLRYDRPYSGYAPIVGAPWLTAFAERSPFAEAFRATGGSQTGTSGLHAELRDLPAEEWAHRLRRLVSDQVALILRRSVDPDRPLAEYGVDSLGALELRTRIEAETGERLAAGDFAVGTVRGLADVLCQRLREAVAG